MNGQQRFTSAQKFDLIQKYLSEKASISSICQKAGVSRKTFYQWLKKYKKNPQLGHYALKTRRPKGSRHWRSIPKEYQKLILEIVSKNPKLSVRKITQKLPKTSERKPVVSHFGVQKFLERKKLNTYQKRLEYCQKPALVKRLPASKRLEMIERVLRGEQVVGVCRAYGISRKTLYKWLKRYLASTPEKVIDYLSDQNPVGEKHWKAIPQGVIDQIIDTVGQHPELSIHKLFALLPKVEGKPVVGYYGLQKILEREELNTFEKRLEFARRRQLEVVPPFVPAPPPEIAPSRLRWILAPFATIPKKIWSTTPSKIFFALFGLFVFWLLEVDRLILSGIIFAVISLFFGLVFFLYASKYYMSLALILSFSAGTQGEEKREREEGRVKKLISRIFAFVKPKRQSRITGLAASLAEVKLERYPFVSVHLPFYNEKRVAERILKACLALEYPNFEVIVVDDSTDETTQICQEYARKDQRIRLIHRDERTGFKGGALQLALEQMNPQTEYVCVFDADFIPFPDTLEQFVKTFQALVKGTNGREATDGTKEPLSRLAPLSPLALSNIAAIQGYQWHVLNKSENWITRGVRTEYAGSYVVERSGIEVYGGLKMIAGSVYMIRADVLKQFGWGTSITEDFELTLKLYEKGYKVVYTPYIQAPAECVSTIRRLIRQRMRWAEGHTFNVKRQAVSLLASSKMTLREKLEFLYLAPYYLQAAFFMAGTISWFLSEAVFKVHFPFWTQTLGWSLVFVNFLSLPLMNLVGLFLEESEEKDYLGIFSFILLSYILVPFQGYAAVKGLLEKEEGPWFRTPKTGVITDMITKVRVFKFFWPFGRRLSIYPAPVLSFIDSFSTYSARNFFFGYTINRRRISWVGKSVLGLFLIATLFLNYLAFFLPTSEARHSAPHLEQQVNIMNQAYSTNATTYAPTDDSLGLVRWEGAKFTGASVYFEALLRLNPYDVGKWTSIYCFSDTSCKVAYYDAVGGDLKFRDCTNSTCTTGTTTVVDGCAGCNTEGNVGQFPSLYCPTATTCKIAYYDATNTNLKFAACGDAACSRTLATYNLLDGGTGCVITGGDGCNSSDDRGKATSIFCPSANNCKIVEVRGIAPSNFYFIDCDDVNCGSGSLRVGTQVGYATGDTQGNRILSLDCRAGSSLCKVLTGSNNFIDCNSEDCNSTARTVTTPDPAAYGGYGLDLYCMSSTDCKLSYQQGGAWAFLDCGDSACTSTNSTITVIDGSGCVLTGCDSENYGPYNSSIFCPQANDCKAVTYDDFNKNLKFADCDNAVCSSGTVRTLDSADWVGNFPSIHCVETSPGAGDAGSNCKIAYYDVSNGDFKFIDCNDATCSVPTINTIDRGPSSGTTAYAALFAGGGGSTPVTCGGGNAEVSTTKEFYNRQRTTCTLSLTNNTTYTVRIKSSTTLWSVQVRAARLIIIQNPGTGNITATQTSVEIGAAQTISSISYADLNYKKFYCYDSTSNGSTACQPASPSVWNPAPTAYFEATLRAGGGTVYAQLFNHTDNLPVSCGAGTAEVSTTSTAYTLVRTSCAVSLSSGKEYKVQVRYAGATGNIANAKLILDQSSDAGGITALETIQLYNNNLESESSGQSAIKLWQNQFQRDNLEQSGQTVSYYFESDLYFVSCGKSLCGTVSVHLYNYTDTRHIFPSVNNNNTTPTRTRSTNLTSNLPSGGTVKDLTIFVDGSSAPEGATVGTNKSWLIIQINNLQIPEAVIYLLPFSLFFPKAVLKIRFWLGDKKRKERLKGFNLKTKL